jgi:hypothetical protein
MSLPLIAMRNRDRLRGLAEIEEDIRIAASLGVDVSEVALPSALSST